MNIRQIRKEDSVELCSLLNEIIAIGGTTAYQKNLNADEFENYFVDGENCVSTFVALKDSDYLGFQCLSFLSKLPHDWLDIATFSRAHPKTPGVGTALFASTLKYAKQNSVSCINATIRADNVPGLAYYSKMGFKDYSVKEGVPLLDGTKVDRISKKYQLD